MKNLSHRCAGGALSVIAVGLALSCAHGAVWTEPNGKTFKGEAIEALGPFAVFSEQPTVGRCLPMQALPLQELARFSVAVKNHPARAKDWAHATSALTAELRGHLEKVEQKKLVPYPVEGRPEPSIVVVLFLNKDAGDNWKLFWGSMEPMGKLGKLNGLVECVGYGNNYGPIGWLDLVKDTFAPWSLVKLDDQPLLKTLGAFVPRKGYRAIAFNRDGVPLFGAFDPDENGVKEFWQQVINFAVLLEPTNPFTWKPLAYYRTAEQMAARPTGHVEPELVGNPIRPGSLARYNLNSFDVTLKLTAEGVVSAISEIKSETAIPPKLHEALVSTLKKAVVVPALENGQPVESEFVYHFRDESPTAP